MAGQGWAWGATEPYTELWVAFGVPAVEVWTIVQG